MEKAVKRQPSFGEPAVEELVRQDHPYRKLLAMVDFASLTMLKSSMGLLRDEIKMI